MIRYYCMVQNPTMLQQVACCVTPKLTQQPPALPQQPCAAFATACMQLRQRRGGGQTVTSV